MDRLGGGQKRHHAQLLILNAILNMESKGVHALRSGQYC